MAGLQIPLYLAHFLLRLDQSVRVFGGLGHQGVQRPLRIDQHAVMELGDLTHALFGKGQAFVLELLRLFDQPNACGLGGEFEVQCN